MIPTTISFGVMVRSVCSKYYRWNRFAIEQDDYSFVISSEGQCYNDERSSTEWLQFMTTLAALVMTFIVYRKFETQVICNRSEHKILINESKQIFVALAVHGFMNIATASALFFLNQTLQADLTRPYVFYMVFPYLWFIVIRSIRSDASSVYYPENSSINIITTGSDDVSDVSSVTMEDVDISTDQILTTVNIMQLNTLAGADDTSSDCSLISMIK